MSLVVPPTLTSASLRRARCRRVAARCSFVETLKFKHLFPQGFGVEFRGLPRALKLDELIAEASGRGAVDVLQIPLEATVRGAIDVRPCFLDVNVDSREVDAFVRADVHPPSPIVIASAKFADEGSRDVPDNCLDELVVVSSFSGDVDRDLGVLSSCLCQVPAVSEAQSASLDDCRVELVSMPRSNPVHVEGPLVSDVASAPNGLEVQGVLGSADVDVHACSAQVLAGDSRRQGLVLVSGSEEAKRLLVVNTGVDFGGPDFADEPCDTVSELPNGPDSADEPCDTVSQFLKGTDTADIHGADVCAAVECIAACDLTRDDQDVDFGGPDFADEPYDTVSELPNGPNSADEPCDTVSQFLKGTDTADIHGAVVCAAVECGGEPFNEVAERFWRALYAKLDQSMPGCGDSATVQFTIDLCKRIEPGICGVPLEMFGLFVDHMACLVAKVLPMLIAKCRQIISRDVCKQVLDEGLVFLANAFVELLAGVRQLPNEGP
jgi:hypothetical protein